MVLPVVPIVRQHAEESAILYGLRSRLIGSPHVKLHRLRRLDDRLAAHLDGLAVAGETAWTLCEAALEVPGPGEIFTAAVRALEDGRDRGLGRLLALGEALPETEPALVSGFGWVSAHTLRGIVERLLLSRSPFVQRVAIGACTAHGADPGTPLDVALGADRPAVRAFALRAAGELGRRDLGESVRRAGQDHDEACRFWAAWSGVLLGQQQALEVLVSFSQLPGPFRAMAQELALAAVTVSAAHELLRVMVREPSGSRDLIHGAAIVGDPTYVPWLIKQMESLELARLAGESFSMITGADLAGLDLDRRRPEGVELGPTESPEDISVEIDPDEDLPWPDPLKVQTWWDKNRRRFRDGERYFAGRAPTRGHCIEVLKTGYQRQRVAAAQYLSLLDPGTPLFNTNAPAWRQQRSLAKIG
jgi:uncharacterized protein (TIGR02270 family)